MRPTDSLERKNVGDLGLENLEQRASLRFDVDRDMSPEDWQRIADYKEVMPVGNLELGEYLAAIADLDRSRLTVASADWKKLSKDLAGANEFGYFRLAGWLKIIDPNHRITIDPKLLRRSIQNITDISLTKKNDDAFFLYHLNRLDPDRSKSYKPDWSAILHKLQLDRRNSVADQFTKKAADIAKLDPSRLNITDEDWTTMRDLLEEYRAVNPKNFLMQASAMAIIARAVPPEAAPAVPPQPMPETKSYT